jgi:hypothetical protein
MTTFCNLLVVFCMSLPCLHAALVLRGTVQRGAAAAAASAFAACLPPVQTALCTTSALTINTLSPFVHCCSNAQAVNSLKLNSFSNANSYCS